MLHAGRSHYQRLLDAGVRLHELNDAVLHAKTAVIDGVVSTVGSTAITPTLWSQRPLAQRALQSLARLFERLW